MTDTEKLAEIRRRLDAALATVCKDLAPERTEFFHNAPADVRWLLSLVDRQDRTIYACSRFFEHCRRVSLSARHAGCDSAEMEIRMSLKKDAEDALKALEDSR